MRSSVGEVCPSGLFCSGVLAEGSRVLTTAACCPVSPEFLHAAVAELISVLTPSGGALVSVYDIGKCFALEEAPFLYAKFCEEARG